MADQTKPKTKPVSWGVHVVLHGAVTVTEAMLEDFRLTTGRRVSPVTYLKETGCYLTVATRWDQEGALGVGASDIGPSYVVEEVPVPRKPIRRVY